MTMSSEQRVSDTDVGLPFDRRWRAAALERQEGLMPAGSAVVSCSAPFGVGGLGRHFKEFVDALERCEQRAVQISGAERDPESSPPRRSAAAVVGRVRAVSRLLAPRSPGKRTRDFMVDFDRYAARRLPAAEHLIAFNGQALAQFQAARRARYSSVSLISANSHLRRVVRQHARAHEQYPIEGSWATGLVERNLAEYAQADRIYVGSQYTRESFLEEGFGDEMLATFPFTPDPRYGVDGARAHTETFDIVYVGSLVVHKGVPLLVDAVRRLPHADIRLRLVGGWASRGMRAFIEKACAEDRRISHGPGDPLPHLRSARLCVHPTYEDGFAYAPAEAVACGVPVIVSEDTGMKDLIDGRNGLILRTGDRAALTDAIDAAYRGELLNV
jgi:glycosyltransferase involved in cell wall biosynthesis